MTTASRASQAPNALPILPTAAQEGLSFIETQFPVSKLSKESYTERKAVAGQTLTGLGKWWGRKPLVLCRATILGLLLPATHAPQKDREVFLRLMTMDDFRNRIYAAQTAGEIYELLKSQENKG